MGLKMRKKQGQMALCGLDTGAASTRWERPGSQKKKFEEQGIPLLILDGDGCDRSHGGEGQTATRLGAFLEMLQA